jgi:hypothetical protein
VEGPAKVVPLLRFDLSQQAHGWWQHREGL